MGARLVLPQGKPPDWCGAKPCFMSFPRKRESGSLDFVEQLSLLQSLRLDLSITFSLPAQAPAGLHPFDRLRMVSLSNHSKNNQNAKSTVPHSKDPPTIWQAHTFPFTKLPPRLSASLIHHRPKYPPVRALFLVLPQMQFYINNGLEHNKDKQQPRRRAKHH